jgi:hypothetical protein
MTPTDDRERELTLARREGYARARARYSLAPYAHDGACGPGAPCRDCVRAAAYQYPLPPSTSHTSSKRRPE